MDDWIDRGCDIDQRVFEDDGDAFEIALAHAHQMRPPRHAWRYDCEAAPLAAAVFARELNSMRVLIAMRDEEGWALITRDGEIKPIDTISAWAPLASALF